MMNKETADKENVRSAYLYLYEEWVFSSYNYFDYNTLKSKAILPKTKMIRSGGKFLTR